MKSLAKCRPRYSQGLKDTCFIVWESRNRCCSILSVSSAPVPHVHLLKLGGFNPQRPAGIYGDLRNTNLAGISNRVMHGRDEGASG